ncbi:amino acid adenylation domain-containing protein [Kitasatospora sp. McL0602]|uniref:amino acid adenylation domain-containing protein n=1 Tax=Kitasatospora sp. McL0602 TaxID=3439530 RepID=UPI003F8AF074
MTEYFPLTAYQRDVWTACTAGPVSADYTITAHERLSGPVDLDALVAAVRRAVLGSDGLRARFGEGDDGPYQWTDPVAAAAEVAVEVAELSAEGCRRRIEAVLALPMDLATGPLFHASVLREGPETAHLLLRAHHIVADGFALDLFLNQVLAHYEQRQAPSESYRTTVEQDLAYRASPEHRTDQEYFRAALGGAEPTLFTRRPQINPAASGSAARADTRHVLVLEPELTARIRATGRSVFEYVAAAVGCYLARLHGTDETVIGVPFLNRRTEQQSRTVGQFANTLPLRIRVGEGDTLTSVAEGVGAGVRELRSHERLALGDVPRPGRSAGRRLFDTTLSYLNLPELPERGGVTRERTGQQNRHDGDALAILVVHHRGSDTVRIELDCEPDVFDEELPPARVAGQLLALIRHGLADPGRPAARLALLDAEGRAAAIRAAHGPAAPLPADLTLHGLFDRQAERTPDRTAVRGGVLAADLGYAELAARAGRVAAALRDAGVAAEDRVAVLVERGPALPAALLGVLRAGAAYVPVDPEYPAERIAYLLRDSGAKAVLVDAATERLVPAGTSADGTSALVLRVDGPLPGGEYAAPVPADHLAYVIYTSGSTGRPKGVMVEHRSVVNRLLWMQRRYPLGPGDVVLQKTPASFDVSVWELFWWAAAGAAVHLLPPGAHRDPRAILAAVAEQRVTVVHFVPSMLGPFLDLLDEEPGLLPSAASLRYVFSSGEALGPELANRFTARFAALGRPPLLVNLYGPTEASIDVSYHDCPPGPASRVPIGRPVDNTRLYVLGPGDEPQPDGVPGELCVGGVAVARGYLGRPGLTGERFGPDPFVPGERLYRTGDLVRRTGGGELEYLGRADDQVKIRGHRVEPGEVRAALAAVPGVRAAVVVARATADRGTQLAAYFTADSDLDPVELHRSLARTLPAHLLPAHCLRIEALPLTPNGKLDRAALPDPDADPGGDPAPGAGRAPSRPPRKGAEAVLVAVWSAVLGTAVGVHDDFYALGGDSLLALRVRAEAERAGLRIETGDLMAYRTVAALAELATPVGGSAPMPEPFALLAAADRPGPAGAEDAFPLTSLQLGMIYHSLRGGTAYRDVFHYRLRLPWDEEHLRAAYRKLTGRHPALRSTIALSGRSEPLQVVHPAGPGEPEIAPVEADLAGHIEQRRCHRYDFEVGPLHHLYVRPGSNAVDLVLSFHHAVLDGGSVAGLLGELLQDYLHGLGADTPAVPVEPPPSPALYATEELRAVASTRSRDYWRHSLGEAGPLQVPGFATAVGPGGGGRFSRLALLPAELDEQVHAFARSAGLPVKSLLFAAHCLTLRLLSGRQGELTGLVVHGRPELPGADRSAGLFLNTLPVQVSSTGRSMIEMARELFRAEQLGHPHRHYPLSRIQEDQGGGALVDTAFNYVHLHVLDRVLSLPEVELLAVRTWEESDLRLLVNAIVSPVDGRLRLRLDCDGRVHTPEQAALVAETFLRILERLVTHPDEPADLAFLAPVESARPNPNPNPNPNPTEEPRPDLARMVRARAQERPEAIAVAFEGCRWTYRQLDRAADLVAHRLLEAGATPGARIGIAMDRSPEYVATVLGVARAGCASMPLDTGYPPARLAAMLRIARPLTVIAHHRHTGLLDGVPVLPAEGLADAAGGVPEGFETPVISPDSTCYVLFTSGSTGEPKAVAMPHRALAALVRWQNRIPSGDVDGSTLQFSALGFDVHLQEIFATLCRGSTLQLVSEERRLDFPELLRLLDREGVERVFLPYVALQQLAETSAALGLLPRALRVIVSAGEQLRVTPEIRRFCAALPAPGVILENQYGPTETHIATGYQLPGPPADFPALPPIGTAVDGSSVHVLDGQLRPLPPGATGEIHLSGDCLADGYENRPELTAERFVTLPDGVRAYRTGDLGHTLPGGAVVCLGRTDAQVKIRGFRIEPAEVELALTATPAARAAGVTEAAVVAVGDGPAAALVAYLVAPEGAVDLDAVRRDLRAGLPGHMVPTHLECLPALPRTPSGKRADAVLRARPLTRRPAGRPEQLSPLERQLAELAAEILGLPDVGRDDDLFDLGATSLTAMRLVVRIEQRTGVAVPVSALTAAPTVARLATLVGSAGPGFDPLVPLRTTGSRPPIFLAHPTGGNVLCYLPLARALPPDQPLYGFQAAGATPGTVPLRSVPEIARSYVAAMRRVRPHGPYTVGGWSFGGHIAFEMAAQLRAVGEEVAEVVLIDSDALDPAAAPESVDGLSLMTWFFWELLWLDGGGAVPEQAFGELHDEGEAFERIRELAVSTGLLGADDSDAVLRGVFEMFRANWEALIGWRPQPAAQDLLLIRAEGSLPEVLKPVHRIAGSLYQASDNGWGRLTTGQVRVVDVPGDHMQLVQDPYVKHVAQILGELPGRPAGPTSRKAVR